MVIKGLVRILTDLCVSSQDRYLNKATEGQLPLRAFQQDRPFTLPDQKHLPRFNGSVNVIFSVLDINLIEVHS
jgi:hypothetical protein